MTGDNVLFKNWYLLGKKKNFTPRPEDRILLPLKGSFQNFRRAILSFLCGRPPPSREKPKLDRRHVLSNALKRQITHCCFKVYSMFELQYWLVTYWHRLKLAVFLKSSRLSRAHPIIIPIINPAPSPVRLLLFYLFIHSFIYYHLSHSSWRAYGTRNVSILEEFLNRA